MIIERTVTDRLGRGVIFGISMKLSLKRVAGRLGFKIFKNGRKWAKMDKNRVYEKRWSSQLFDFHALRFWN
jgi:hypothetical protein